MNVPIFRYECETTMKDKVERLSQPLSTETEEILST